jgi:hypothetical protein
MKTNSFLVAASMALAMALTFSCSSGDDDENPSPSNGGGSSSSGGQGSSFNENSQVYNEEDGAIYAGSGIIEVASHISCNNNPDGTGGSCPDWSPSLIAGSVTNGIVRLELPNNIPNGHLEELDYYSNYDCTAYTEDIKMFGGMFVLTNNNGEFIGSLDINYDGEQIQEQISYVYFSRAGKLNCKYEEEWEGRKFKDTINIEAKVGWNKVYVRGYMEGNMTIEEWSTNNILTKEIRWEIPK